MPAPHVLIQAGMAKMSTKQLGPNGAYSNGRQGQLQTVGQKNIPGKPRAGVNPAALYVKAAKTAHHLGPQFPPRNAGQVPITGYVPSAVKSGQNGSQSSGPSKVAQARVTVDTGKATPAAGGSAATVTGKPVANSAQWPKKILRQPRDVVHDPNIPLTRQHLGYYRDPHPDELPSAAPASTNKSISKGPVKA